MALAIPIGVEVVFWADRFHSQQAKEKTMAELQSSTIKQSQKN
jgi:hypothetical protein